MAELLGVFNTDGFYQALDAVRRSRELQWKQVSEESGVGAWTFTRLAQGRRPDVDTLAALAAWSGLDMSDYIVSEQENRPSVDTLAIISTAISRDTNLDEQAKKAMDDIIKITYERMRKSE